MELNEIKNNRSNIYHIKENCINIINARKGKIILPDVDNLCQLQIIFFREGEFEILTTQFRNGPAFKIGNMTGDIIIHKVGEPGYDTQPSFVYNPKETTWMIISIGMINFKEDEMEPSDLCPLPC